MTLKASESAVDSDVANDASGEYALQSLEAETPGGTYTIGPATTPCTSDGGGGLGIELDPEDPTDAWQVIGVSGCGEYIIVMRGETTMAFFPDDSLPGDLPAGTELDVANEATVIINNSFVNATIEAVTFIPPAP